MGLGPVTDKVEFLSRKSVGPFDQAQPVWVMGPFGLTASIVGLEAALIVAVAVATGVGYHLAAYREAGDVANYAGIGALTALFFLLPLVSGGLHRAQAFLEGKRSHGRIFVTWNVAFLCLAFVGVITKTTGLFSRAWLVAFYATGLLAMMALDRAIIHVLAGATAKGRIAVRRLMLVGTHSDIARMTAAMDGSSANVRIVATAVLPEGVADEGIDEVLESALDNARRLRIDDVVIVTDWSQEGLIQTIVTAFRTLPVVVHLGISGAIGRVCDTQITSFGSARALSLTAAPLTPVQAGLKRTFDVVAAGTALLLLSPLFLAIAWLIRRDSPGPIFFRQRRRGYNLEEFRIWKFRTMTTLDDGDVVQQATVGDVRVTGVGQYLRKWNLDELPQLINVLTGDMSLVGPRPHAVAHDRFFETRIDQYRRRLNVKPGITGWAQVNGHRGPTETDAAMRARVEHDLYYIDNWSLWLDIYILIATVVARKAFKNAL